MYQHKLLWFFGSNDHTASNGIATHTVDVNSDLELDNVTLDESRNSGVRGQRREVRDGVVDGDGGGESDT